MTWKIPATVSNNIMEFAKHLDCRWIGAVTVNSQSAYDYDDCHNSVRNYVSIYGGQQILCFYFVQGFNDLQAIKHSIWHNGTEYIDIMPYKDGREYNIIGVIDKNSLNNSLPNYYFQSLAKYQEEIEIMYYVYQLVDPRNNLPFYIGKGKGNRAQTHLFESTKVQNLYKDNKIRAIRNAGLEPRIEYIAENIIDEQLAYKIEEDIIKHYGRKGYEDFGILTNVCADNRPPNHKGKNYEEIYGVAKAQQQKQLRSQLQKQRGGYGPKQHTPETKKKLSELTSGVNNPMHGRKQKDSTKKIIADKAKLRTGKLNKNSKQYKLTSPDGREYILWGNEAAIFCKEHDLSWSTLKLQIQKAQWGIPRKGKTKGWKLEIND